MFTPRFHHSPVALLALTLLAAPGCGDDASTDPDASGDDAASLPDAGEAADSASGVDAGGGEPIFEVTEASLVVTESRWGDGTQYSEVRAGIWDPAPAFHQETTREGFCRFLSYEPTSCDPPCSYGEICTPDGDCDAYPTFLSAGTITLSGLKTAVTLSYGGSYYMVDQYPLPEDLFDAGDSISASAPGDTFPTFSVTTTGAPTASLALTGDQSDEMRLVDGSSFTVTWGAADASSRVRLQLLSPNMGHGLPATAIIECDAPDTGSLVIPQALIEAFPPQTRLEICVGHDCPPSTFLRYRRGTTSTAGGDVELLVGSKRYFFLVHEVQ